MSARSYRRGIALLIPFMFVVLAATEAEAALGSETFVIVGGRQEPAKSYTLTYWPGSAYGCNTPYARVDIYVRWYLDQVQSTRVFIDKVWIRVKPTRSGIWDHVELYDIYGNLLKTTPIFQRMAANTYYRRTFQYDRWVPISTTAQIKHWNIFLMDGGNEYTGCNGDGYAIDYLRRR